MNNKQTLWAIICFLLGVVLTKLWTLKQDNNNNIEVDSHRWDKVELVLEQIEKNYVDSIDYAKINEEVVPFILKKLDPHSVYLPPVDLEEADETLRGNFDGIGILFNMPADTAVIINAVRGGPSEKVGLISGDRIMKVDGKDVAGVSINQDSLVKMMKGVSGTTVDLTIQRGDELVPFEITRAKIPVKSIDVAYMINDTTAYVKLSQFSKITYSEFKPAMEDLISKGMKKLIFDLRGNSGGFMDQALLLANEFLSRKDLIVYMEGEHRRKQEFHADGSGICKDVAIDVLIDEASASSSEIFAGAIQDNDRGRIIGRRSYGKGLVQEPIYFSDNSGIRLTVARFYTPSGRSIQKPYSSDEDNYAYDIIDRYNQGEMTEADSIPKNESLKFTTKGGRIVYGGGGIIPDLFVPLDTAGVNDMLIKINRRALQTKFSISMMDKYSSEIREVENLSQLSSLLDKMNLEEGFKTYVNNNGISTPSSQWNESKNFLVVQVRAIIGRYSKLEDNAYFPIISEIDNVIQAAI